MHGVRKLKVLHVHHTVPRLDAARTALYVLLILVAIAAPTDAGADAFLFGGSPTGTQELEIATNLGTFEIAATGYGTLRDDGRSQRGYGVGRIDATGHTYRNFFIFDLETLRGLIADPATLDITRASISIGNAADGYSGPATSVFTAWYPGFHSERRLLTDFAAGDPTGKSFFDRMSSGQALQRVEVGEANNITNTVSFDLNADVLPLLEAAIRNPYPDGGMIYYNFIVSGSLNENIPEPGTLALVVTGLTALYGIRRRHRKLRDARRSVAIAAQRVKFVAAALAGLFVHDRPASAAALWTLFNPIEDATQVNCGNLCWAAATANAIAYAGWGVPNSSGTLSGQSVFDEIRPIALKLYGDRPGNAEDAAEIYFDLHRADWGVPTGTTWKDWKANILAAPNLLLPAMAPRIVDALVRGSGTAVSVDLPGGRHLINAWGYRSNGLGFLRADDIDRLVITDNESSIRGPTVVDVPVTGSAIRNYERVVGTADDPVLVKLTADISGTFAIKSRNNRVHVVQGNDLRLDRYPTSYILGADGRPIGPDGPLELSGSNQPLISEAVVDFLRAIARRGDALGISDAPVIGFNGAVLSASDTGWDSLRYVPGPGVADQVAGNGIDDLTTFSFSFPRLSVIDSAMLTLELTPRSPGVSTDEIFFPGSWPYNSELNIGNTILRSLPVGVTSTIVFNLADVPDVGSLLFRLRDGEFSVIYGDDAIVHSATLDVIGTLDRISVPEPSSALLLLSILALSLSTLRFRESRLRLGLADARNLHAAGHSTTDAVPNVSLGGAKVDDTELCRDSTAWGLK